MGKHTGLAAYTIGQRKGLGISGVEPYYVVEKDIQENTLVIGYKNFPGRDVFFTEQNNWISGTTTETSFKADVKVRYKSRVVPATITPLPDNQAKINLSSRLPDITPGQAAVFYQDQICLGGGIIRLEDS